MEREYVILVDENDRQTGTCEKLEAHQRGLMHRAFSIFLFNKNGDFLLQQRANEKYHTPGLWSNTCCSHPRPDEEMEEALERKLFQEMGIHSLVEKVFDFAYRADFENGLVENEVDHVYFGEYNDSPNPNPSEIQSWKYSSFEEIKEEIAKHEASFTPWFKLVFERVNEHYKKMMAA